MIDFPQVPGDEENDLEQRLEWEISEVERELENLERKERLRELEFLPTQAKYLAAVNDPTSRTICFTAANQTGKSFVLACDVIADALGYEPWSGLSRARSAYGIALLLRDYDSHGKKFLLQNILELIPKEFVDVEYTQNRAPRVIRITDPYTGRKGTPIFLFTHDQDPARLEGSTWQSLFIDEPCPRTHYMALVRGLQKTAGKTRLVMTPISEPWIFDELYSQAGNLGGPKKSVIALTAFPDENLKSQGGHLDDEAVNDFRTQMTREEKQARVHGRWTHLMGRIYKSYDEDVHVIDDDMEVFGSNQKTVSVVGIDPHGRMPWAILWATIGSDGTYVIEDEYPDDEFQPNSDSGLIVADYGKIILRHDPGMAIMDPNRGRTKSISSGSMLFEELEDVAGIPILTDVNDDQDSGHDRVRSLFSYDHDRPIGASNQPKLLIRARCKNLRKALQNYIWDEHAYRSRYHKTPKAVPQEKSKHFPDALRYICVYDLNPKLLGWRPRTQDPRRTRAFPRKVPRVMRRYIRPR